MLVLYNIQYDEFHLHVFQNTSSTEFEIGDIFTPTTSIAMCSFVLHTKNITFLHFYLFEEILALDIFWPL